MSRFLCIYLLCALGSQTYGYIMSGSSQDDKICMTEECINTAHFLKEQLNESVNPCDDMYEFACGNFLNNPAVQPESSTFVQILQKSIDKLEKLLKYGINNEDIQPLQIVQKYYNSCTKNINVSDLNSIVYTLLKNYTRDWPIPSKMRDKLTYINLMNLIKVTRNAGIQPNGLFLHAFSVDLDDADHYIISLMPPDLSVSLLDNGDINQKELETYSTTLINTVKYFSKRKNISDYADSEIFINAMEILQFELKLAKVLNVSQAESQVVEILNKGKTITIDDFEKQYPVGNDWKWIEILQSIIGFNTTLNSSQKIFLQSPTYMKNLVSVLKATSPRIAINYCIWKYIVLQFKELSSPKDSRTCTYEIQTIFSDVLIRKYLKYFFDENDRQIIFGMTERLLKVMIQEYKNYKWLDNATRDKILDKIDQLVVNVAYSKDMVDSVALMKKYAMLNVTSTYYPNFKLSVNKWVMDFEATFLQKLPDREQWPLEFSTFDANAAYLPFSNSILIFTALLQENMFSAKRPSYLNYGSIGFIVGHELSHAFDNIGRKFDSLGRRRLNLWTKTVSDTYDAKVKCFEEQYNKIWIPEWNKFVNGKQTLRENIADNEGILKARKAYANWAKVNCTEKQLPGLKYTPQQLFWISTAVTFCNRLAPQQTKAELDDSHAPARARIIGMAMNNKDFSIDFSCPLGSKMNPKKKCSFD